MMKIKTRKFNDRGLTRLIKQAAKFYAYQLIPEHYDQIYLDIYANKIKADGTCLQLDRYDFEIEINKNISFECMMITLAHEMIHLKQYATKELKSKIVKGNEVDIWKGVKYKNMKYHDQPWEQEATDLEEELYHKFLLYSLMSGTLDFNRIKQIDQRAS
jgi:hypothetical protein